MHKLEDLRPNFSSMSETEQLELIKNCRFERRQKHLPKTKKKKAPKKKELKITQSAIDEIKSNPVLLAKLLAELDK